VASVSARHNIFTPFILVPPVLLLSFLVCQPAAMRMDSSMRFPGPSFTAVMAKKLEASSLGLSEPAGQPAVSLGVLARGWIRSRRGGGLSALRHAAPNVLVSLLVSLRSLTTATDGVGRSSVLLFPALTILASKADCEVRLRPVRHRATV
jgi:hypothetical protein